MSYSARVAVFSSRAEKHYRCNIGWIEDKRAAILDHRSAPAIPANYKGIIKKVADDVEHRPGLDDQRAMAIGNGVAIAHIEAIIISTPGISLNDGVSRDYVGAVVDIQTPPPLSIVFVPSNVRVPASNLYKSLPEVIAPPKVRLPFVGVSMVSLTLQAISKLTVWVTGVVGFPVETKVATQRDAISAQREGSGGGIKREPAHRDARKVVIVQQSRAAGKSQTNGEKWAPHYYSSCQLCSNCYSHQDQSKCQC